MGLGGEDQPDEFEEYDENESLKIKDTTQHSDNIKNMLIEKNMKYGDSALNPVRIMSKADSVEQIKVRIDDKLSRLSQGHTDDNEDVIHHLLTKRPKYVTIDTESMRKPKLLLRGGYSASKEESSFLPMIV